MVNDEEQLLPETGAIFTFGKSHFNDSVPSRFWIKNDKVIDCSCGDSHTAIVTESRRVFVFGLNDHGQLGLGHSTTITRPTCIKALKPQPAAHVACGKSHTVISDENGRLYACGLNRDGQLGLGHTDNSGVPRQLPSWCQQLQQLAAGEAHTVLLTRQTKQVFVWGSNAEGQCGLGDLEQVTVPTLLTCDEPIVQISCGYRHTALVSETGRLYVMGNNENGQLGLPGGDSFHDPVVVTSPDHIQQVACGGLHTLALDKNGDVFVFGSGANGQLGLGAQLIICSSPTPLALDRKAVRIAAGFCHSAVLSESNKLLMFGDAKYGKLCYNETDDENIFTPRSVGAMDSLTIENVVLGGNQSILLVTPYSDADELVVSVLTKSSGKDSALATLEKETPCHDTVCHDATTPSAAPTELRSRAKSKWLPPLKIKPKHKSSATKDDTTRSHVVKVKSTPSRDQQADVPVGSQKSKELSEQAATSPHSDRKSEKNKERGDAKIKETDGNKKTRGVTGKINKIFGKIRREKSAEALREPQETREPTPDGESSGARSRGDAISVSTRKTLSAANASGQSERQQQQQQQQQQQKRKDSRKDSQISDDEIGNKNATAHHKCSPLNIKSTVCGVM